MPRDSRGSNFVPKNDDVIRLRPHFRAPACVDLDTSLFSNLVPRFQAAPAVPLRGGDLTWRRYEMNKKERKKERKISLEVIDGRGGGGRGEGREENNRRPMRLLIINRLDGGRMRSLPFFFFLNKQEGGLHQTHRCTYPLTDTRKLFWPMTLHVSCCYGDAHP